MNNNTTPRPDMGRNKNSCFFMIAAHAVFNHETLTERTLNVLIETSSAHITKSDLAQIHQSVMRRLKAENGVSPEQIEEIVILSLNLLGVMPPEVFHNTRVQAENPTPSEMN